MKRHLQWLLVFFVVTGVVSTTSHVIVRFFGIRTGGIGYKLLGGGKGEPLAFAEGSSLMVEGLAWQRIAEEVGTGVENWFVAGSSPSEWERLQSRASNAKVTFIVVSAYDLNEHFLCDFRANVVPISQTIRDLYQSRVDWPFAKRVLSQYPIRYLRILFPTLGRSDGILVGIREKLSEFLQPWVQLEPEKGPTVPAGPNSTDEEIRTDKLSDWSQSRLLRRLALMRSACQGKSTFDGPKKLAFLRMVAKAERQGHVVIIVLPVSPLYASEFLKANESREFQDTLSEVERADPNARWVHLEKTPALLSNDYFWDLVHLNQDGRQIATEAVLNQLHIRLSSE